MSNPETGAENENPGALAGATGADLVSIGEHPDHTLNRRAAAMALADAAADCPEPIRARLLERLLDTFRPGWPIPAFPGTVLLEARAWAETASRVELKGYALACVERMPSDDRAAFLAFVAGSAAA